MMEWYAALRDKWYWLLDMLLSFHLDYQVRADYNTEN